MTEAEFIAAFESDFPYDNDPVARSIIEQAIQLSAAASFFVALKLVRPPQEKRVSVTRRVELLSVLRKQLNHPLAALVLGIAERMIYGQRLPPDEVCQHLHTVAEHSDQYGALNIVYLSAGQSDNDIINMVYDMIVTGWHQDAQIEAAARQDGLL
jgi:hypothetical protein